MNYSTPLISVLMPVYNAAPHIREAIESILNQTFSDFELLVFNDGSADESGNIIRSIVDKRIILHDSKENMGYVAHLNRGIQLAKGKYIARMDADDIALPTRFEKQVAYLEENPDVGLCGTSYCRFGAETKDVIVPEHDEEIRKFLLHDSPMGHPTVMFRKSLIEYNGLHYDRDFMPAEDYKLWYDISKVAKIYNIPEVLLRYRVHQHQISSYMNSTQRSHADKVRVLQLSEKGFQLTPEEQRIYCQVLQVFPLPQSARAAESWRLLMRKVKSENQRLRAYDESWFNHMFEPAWLAAIGGVEKYTLRHIWPLVLHSKPTRNSLALGVQVRTAIKCIIRWKVKY